MKHQVISFIAFLFISLLNANSQTLNVDAMSQYPASTVREVYEIAKYTPLDSAQHHALAKALIAYDEAYAACLKADNGVLKVNSQRELEKMYDKLLAANLSDEQLRQYWRGVYDKESLAEANAITNDLRARYNLTDQNCKFVRVAFYKIGIDSRVNNKLLPPAQARKANEKLRRHYIDTIEKKGGIRLNDDMTMTVVKPFDPNSLHK